MKTFGVIMLFLLFIIIGGTVFVILNRPANLLIRKTFKSLTGLEIVSSKAMYQASQDNIILNNLQKQLRFEVDSLLEINSQITGELILSKERSDQLEKKINIIEGELADAKVLFDSMTVTDQIIQFDVQTKGSKASFISSYEGHDVVLTEPSRVTDAAWKMHEGKVMKEIAESQQERIYELTSENNMLERIAANLNSAIDKCNQENQLSIQKLQNCENASDETIKKAKRFAGAGVGSIALAIAIVLLL